MSGKFSVGSKTQPPTPIQPLTPDTLKIQLGYPDIRVDPHREKQCPNCGKPGHDEKTCTAPTMSKIFEAFGPKLYDSTPQAIKEKENIIEQLLNQK